jgi:hypothetical protein
VYCCARSGSECSVVAGPLPPQQHPQSRQIELCMWYPAYGGRLYELVYHEPLDMVDGVEGGAEWLALQVGDDWGSPLEVGSD